VLADSTQHVAHIAVWNPVGKPDLTSGLADSEKLPGGPLLVGGEHHPHRGEHHVEGGVRVG